MPQKLMRVFTNSAGALLLAAAVALFIANWATADVVQLRDPVLMISMSHLFWIVGASGAVVALICVLGERAWLKVALVLWLAANFLIHQWGFHWMGHHRGYDIYLYSFAHTFGLESQTAMFMVRAVFTYLIIGSFVSLLWLWKQNKGYLKTACTRCGGHIEFPKSGVGQRTSCPHCGTAITLQPPPGNLTANLKRRSSPA